jgi:hypothetical protein
LATGQDFGPTRARGETVPGAKNDEEDDEEKDADVWQARHLES